MVYYRPPGFRNLFNRVPLTADPSTDPENDYYRPPPPPSPIATQPSRIARAAGLLGEGFHAVGSAVGAPARGLGMAADLLQENMAGIPDELSRVRLTRPADEGGVLGDIFSPDIQAPSAAQLSMEGLGMLSGARLPRIDRPGALVPIEEDPVQRAMRQDPTLGRIMAVAEPAAELGTAFGTDPALGLLGSASNGGRIARAAERAIGLGIIPGMVEGAYHGGQEYLQQGAEHGYTSPEALRAGTQAGMDAALAAAGLHSAFRGAPRPELLEGEYIPAQEALPAAPPLQLEAPVIDVEGRVVQDALPPATPPAPFDRMLDLPFSSVPRQPAVDPSGVEGFGVEPVSDLVPTGVGQGRARQEFYRGPGETLDTIGQDIIAAGEGFDPIMAQQLEQQRAAADAGLAETDALAAQGLPAQRSAITRAAARLAEQQALQQQEAQARGVADLQQTVRGQVASAMNPTEEPALGAALRRRPQLEVPGQQAQGGPLIVPESYDTGPPRAFEPPPEPPPPAPAPPVEMPREGDRRAATVPVVDERRSGEDRRARIAAENGLHPEHPAVEKLAQLEERAAAQDAAAAVDPLTGLMSKPAWDARRAANPHHAVLAADLANFKKTNDRYGHGNADLVIKALAEGLGRIAPGRAARPHGDEMLADFDTIEEAQAAATALQEHASRLQIEVAMPDGTRETITGVRVHTGTGVKRGPLDAEQAADYDLNERAGPERRARKDGRGLAAEGGGAPVAGGPDRVGEAGPLVRATPQEVAPVPVEPEVLDTYEAMAARGEQMTPIEAWDAYQRGEIGTHEFNDDVTGEGGLLSGYSKSELAEIAKQRPDFAREYFPEVLGDRALHASTIDVEARRVEEPARGRKSLPPAPLAGKGQIVRAKADWNAFPEHGEESAQRGKAGEYRVSAVDETTGETYLQPVDGGQDVLAAREGQDLSNFEVVKKPAALGPLQITNLRGGTQTLKGTERELPTPSKVTPIGRDLLKPDLMLDPGVDWRGGHVTNLIGEGGWAVASKDGAYSDRRYESAEEAKKYLTAAEARSKVDFFEQDNAAETPRPKPRPGSSRWQMLDADGVGVGSGMGRTEEEAIADYRRAGGAEKVASAQPLTGLDKPGPRAIVKSDEVATAAAQVEEEPSPAQMEAGNYKKGHVAWNGLDLTIETPKGGTRRAKDGSWKVEDFPAHYGYVKGTEGKDGDHVDIYLGDDLKSERVFAIDQIDPKTQKFDEHKVMLGFPSEDAALEAYDRAFDDGSGPMRRGATTEMPVAKFKEWLEKGNTKAPIRWKAGFQAPPRENTVDEAGQPIRVGKKAGDGSYVAVDARRPVDKAPEKADIQASGGRDGDAGVPAKPAQRPETPDPTALAGVPASDGEGAPEGRPARPGDQSGGEPDEGRLPQRTGEGSQRRPGVGDGPERVGVPAGGEGKPGPTLRPGTSLQEFLSVLDEAGASTDMVEGARAAVERKNRGHDHRITTDALGVGGPKAKLKTNLEAIKLLRELEKEGRLATTEEQDKLAQYVGWGAFPQLFTRSAPGYYDREWGPLREELEGLLSTDELKAARHSTINAHYTSVPVVRAMWDAAERLGVGAHARVLEPALGIGHFFGLQPESMLPAKRTGVELDPTSGAIARALYPRAAVFVKGLQETKLPKDHYDLVISNVPFANVGVHDPSLSKHPEVLKSLHDYFFAKTLEHTRPGGAMALITTHYTMDKKDSGVRKYLGARAELLGAIRLPNTAFKANAGTEVVTDIIFLRKLLPGEKATGESWADAQELEVPGEKGKTEKVNVNEYFHRHPEMVLGKQAGVGSMYREGEYTVTGEITPEALAAAIERLPKDAIRPYAEPASDPIEVAKLQVGEADAVKSDAYVVKDGQLMQRRGEFYEVVKPGTAEESRIRGMIFVRDAARKLLDVQLRDGSDTALAGAQKDLGKAYDAFVKKHGYLNERANAAAFDEDPDAPLLRALEEWDPDTKKGAKAAIFTKRTVAKYTPVEHADKADEALTVSLNETGRLDWKRMEALTGRKRADLQKELGDLVYENPEGGGWDTSDRYLSGNVRAKLAIAESAAEADPRFSRNVTALKGVQPKDLQPTEINVRLGSPWIPPTDVAAFVTSILDLGRASEVNVAYAKDLAAWAVSVPDHARRSVLATEKWGTGARDAKELIEDALNLRQPTVKDRDNNTLEGETLAAREKQSEIQEAFRKWLWEDDSRAKRLGRVYNDTFNNTRIWKPKGDHLTLPGMARLGLRGGDLGPHQKNAVWRIMQANPRTNVLLNHAVGAGKTFEVIAGIMERRRVGLTQKGAVVVPNHLIGQWGSDFRRLYPSANVLVVEKKHVTPAGRQQLMSRIATGRYDAVVLSMEAFSKLPVQTETYKRFMEAQIAELESALIGAEAEAGGGGRKKSGSRIVKELEKAKERLQAKLDKYLATHKKDAAVTWEDLGVDLLAVDEAHAYKRLDTPSKLQVAGIARGGSNRAMDMFMKSRHLNERGGVVVWASGTPVTNTLGETYVIQKFLQPEILKERGLEHFDSWVANHATIKTAIELTVTGKFKAKDRLAKFVNVSELSSMMAETMDTMLPEQLDLPRPKHKVVTHVAPSTAFLKAYISDLAKRADAVRGRGVDPKIDNFLKITTDGRKAGTDLRLVDPTYGDDAGSKINLAVGKIHEIWKATANRKATQIVFLDLSTPKEGEGGEEAPVKAAAAEAEGEEAAPVAAEQETAEEAKLNTSLYEDIRSKLVKKGIPRAEIAFIHDVKTDADKARLNLRMNSGQVRVLVGSTAKMGTGLNVQKKLFALHLISPPFRPDQVEQAEGRIIRQGNEHFDLDVPVEIHRYATEGSYDAVMWQMLENKAGFIGAFMRSEPGIREIEDVGAIVLGFAQMKAIASGNPKILEKVAVDGEVDKLERLQMQFALSQHDQQRRLKDLKSGERFQVRRLKELTEAADKYEKAKVAAGKDFSITVGKKEYTDREEAGIAILEAAAELEKEKLARDDYVKIGERLGFPIDIKFHEAVLDGKKIEYRPGLRVGDESASLSENPGGTIASIDSRLRGFEGQRDGMKGQLARTRKEMGDLETELAKPWKDAEKLERLRKRQTELSDELSEKKMAEAPPAGEPGAPAAAAEGLRAAADRARKRMSSRKPTANDLGAAAATGAGAFYDASVIGADLFARGVRRFGDWSRIMLKQVGDGIRTFLRKVFDESHRIFNQFKKGGAATAGAPPRTPPPPRAGATPPAEPKGPRPMGERLGAKATEAGKRAQKIADTFQSLNEKYTTARTHAEDVAAKGTIPKEEREAFRNAGQPDKEQTKSFRFSAEDIKRAGAEMVDAVREFRKAEQEFSRGADPDSAAAMRTARVLMEHAVKRWQVYRSAAGRAVKTFDEPIPASVIEGLREAGVIAGKLKEVKERAPIASNILNGLKNWKGLSDAEKKQFARDVVDHYRLNLFSVTSWTLDLIGNMAELAGQAGAGLGRDLVFATRTGEVSFPSMQGLLRAIRAKAPFHPIEQGIEEELGTSVSGEHLREGEKGGTFTYRSNLGSKIYDYVVGGPLYAKGAFDTAAKRLGATWTIYRDAIEAAARRGLKGGDRERFIEDFVNNIPEETRKAAVENGNKAGFNRELSDLEEKVANSTTARLLVDTFARWPFQFTRWAAEMLGYNRPLFDKMRAGTLKPEEIGEYLGKVAVGFGGLYLINQLYDRTDFNSMEYVDEEGNRVRLSNRDPIPSALWLLAVIHGDTAKATAALRHASVPGARLLAGEGGLLGSAIKGFQGALANPQNDPRALRREFEDSVNRAIPGQAVLSALKTVFDPTIREGIGANLPGISLLQDAAVNPVTGKPLEPRQRVAGIELPSIGGTPIPGATRILEPVQKLLSRYGLQVYRGPRTPIAGYPAGQMPQELQREWSEEFGKARNQLLTPLARLGKALEARPDEAIRKMIQQRDAAAAKVADNVMRRKYGGPRKLPRQPTMRELAGPDVYRK